ncbi:MAG: hypothetical protein COB93_11460 [Sneathiella sp.]|nr:MAG: hypothetical protein COB93_11460 [Sneathiella sp.]
MRENTAKELETGLDAGSLSKIKVRRSKDAKNASPKKVKSGDITDRLQALADELEATKPAVAVAKPAFEDDNSGLFETEKKRLAAKAQPKITVSPPVTEEPPLAKPVPASKKKAKVAVSPKVLPKEKPAAQKSKKPASQKPRKAILTPDVASAVPPRRANWARPAAAPGWQKKVSSPDILTYWMELRNGNRYPTWQNLDTQKIGKFWPNCLLVHCDHGVGRLQLQTGFSNELRRSAKQADPLRDLSSDIDFTPMVVDWVLNLARDVANSGKPAHGTEYFPSAFDEFPLRVIALPLSSDQIDIDHVLCYVQKL